MRHLLKFFEDMVVLIPSLMGYACSFFQAPWGDLRRMDARHDGLEKDGTKIFLLKCGYFGYLNVEI